MPVWQETNPLSAELSVLHIEPVKSSVYIVYIALHHFECLILSPDHSFYFFLPLTLTRCLFDILPVTTEANPTDVSKAAGVKQANTHLIVLWLFLAAIGTFRALCSKSHEETFLSLSDGWNIKLWCVLLLRVEKKKTAICEWLTADGSMSNF